MSKGATSQCIDDHREAYNAILDAMIAFQKVHYDWANKYIHQRMDDPKGTGGKLYMQWLKQLLTDTEAHRL